ncbi:MAG: helix-hairpin-helix domain-containing protein [Bacteroidota bacterium]|nr:helix-hairpin-helix domain-containing protein [Bacteroidota bacterium]
MILMPVRKKFHPIRQWLILPLLAWPIQVTEASVVTESDAQSTCQSTAETEMESILTELAENGITEATLEEFREQLTTLLDHPIAINTAAREQLESIPFLSKDQTEALSYYLYRYGPMMDVSELLLVDGFNEQTLKLLVPFIYLSDTLTVTARQSVNTILNYGKQEFRITAGRCVQSKRGYTETSSPAYHYAGDPWMCSFRYGFNYKNTVQMGITCQKDAGETWLTKQHFPDYTSFHLLYRGKKFINTLVAGDYTVSLGQGLVCGHAFGLGKTLSSTQPEIYGQSLKRHVSTAESGFLRGLACQFNLLKEPVHPSEQIIGSIQLLTFGSIRHLDANVSGKEFTSISESGLHRTEQEQAVRNRLLMVTEGTHLSIKTQKAQIGLTAMYWQLNATMNPQPEPYNLFYPRVNQGGNTAVNYRLRWMNATWFGELAADNQAHLACLSGVSMKPSARMDLSLLYRNYSPSYNAFFGHAFGEGTSVRNEKGYYASLEWQIMSHMRLNAYYDLFIFPWLTYQCHEPSSGDETAFQTVCKLSKQAELLLRFKAKQTVRNESSIGCHIPVTTLNKKRQIRVQYTDMTEKWTFQSVFDYNTFENEVTHPATNGIALSQTIRYSLSHPAIELSTKCSLFDAVNYENCIYSYEKSLPGIFSMPSFYGQGARFSLCLSYSINQTVTCWFKSGHFFYRDRSETGTNGELVNGNCLTDIQGLLRIKF